MKGIYKFVSVLLLAGLCASLAGCNMRNIALAGDPDARLATEESKMASKADKEQAQRQAEERKRQEAEEEQKLAAAKTRVAQILEYTHAFEGLSLTVPYAVSRTFHENQYSWTIEPYNGSSNIYIATCSGYYSPNPYVAPNLAQYGSISWAVDIDQGVAVVYEDPDNITGTFFVIAYP